MRLYPLTIFLIIVSTLPVREGAAEIYDVSFNIGPGSAGDGFAVDALINGASIVDLSNSDAPTGSFSGSLQAIINMNPSTGRISSISPIFDPSGIAATDASLEFLAFGGNAFGDDATAVNVVASLDPSVAEIAVDEFGNFDLSQLLFRFTGGHVNVVTTIGTFPVELATSFVEGPLVGTGTASATPINGTNNFRIDLNLPLDLQIPVFDGPTPFGNITATMSLGGAISATGIVTVIPEPSSGLLFVTATGSFICVRRRRHS